jgi:hypothetical protein
MKILFEFSRSGLKDHGKSLHAIRGYLLKRGHTLTNDLLCDTKKTGVTKLPKQVFSVLKKSISQSDCVIIEASAVSLSLGYVLTKAISLGKPVLFLKSDKANYKKSRFADSIKSKLLISHTYTSEKDMINKINLFLKRNRFIKTRFNLVLPNYIDSYVTIESKKEGISKTQFIINLIKERAKQKTSQ